LSSDESRDDDEHDPTGPSAKEEPVAEMDHLMNVMIYICTCVNFVHGSKWADGLSPLETVDEDELMRKKQEEWKQVYSPHWWPVEWYDRDR